VSQVLRLLQLTTLKILDFFGEATAIGIEWHSAADFMADGLKIGASFSTDTGAAAGASVKLESSWGLGATYVTSAGDTSVTIGAGLADSDWKDSGSSPSTGSNGFHIGFSAVTGDLTVAAGYANGDKVADGTTANESEVNDNTVTKVGAKYVAGDITLSLGYTSGAGNSSVILGTAGSDEDAKDTLAAGISYAVASGVTANIGYVDVESQVSGSSETSGGTSWYIGVQLQSRNKWKLYCSKNYLTWYYLTYQLLRYTERQLSSHSLMYWTD